MAYEKDTPFELVAIVSAMFGEEYGDKVRAQCGGRDFYVPHQWSERNPLASILGRDRMNSLCHEVGGVRFYIPTSKAERRAAEVVRLHGEGKSSLAIMKIVGITQSQVWHILKRQRAAAASVRTREDAAP